MKKPFKGTINVDIRDSKPDWEPFEPPMAPAQYIDLEREAQAMLMRE